MKKCLICDAALESFISFGRMPIANGFLTPDQFADEYFFELAAGVCTACHMVQLVEQPARERMFHDAYPFYSSTSVRMGEHFSRFAEQLLQAPYWTQSADPFVVELGCNDGILLKHFARRGIRHLGIEPSQNVAEVARQQGLEVVTEFFDRDLAEQLRSAHGGADAVLAANVICHIDDFHAVAAGIRKLLKPRGVFVFEDPYLGDIVRKTSYDQIYDEHVFYFSVTALTNALAQHDLELVDVSPQDVHGGSMRYTIAARGAWPPSANVARVREAEAEQGLHRVATFMALRERIEQSRDLLRAELERLHREGQRVVGYAATSKSTTVINYCGITPDLVEYISDTTPIKQGKYSPGAHLPIKSHAVFAADYPDCALLFAWNHAAEIMARESRFHEQGGKWLVYVPQVALLDAAEIGIL